HFMHNYNITIQFLMMSLKIPAAHAAILVAFSLKIITILITDARACAILAAMEDPLVADICISWSVGPNQNRIGVLMNVSALFNRNHLVLFFISWFLTFFSRGCHILSLYHIFINYGGINYNITFNFNATINEIRTEAQEIQVL
ncbi:hypothetical protein ACJX0J_036959, partial [Zea mays]